MVTAIWQSTLNQVSTHAHTGIHTLLIFAAGFRSILGVLFTSC